MEDVNKLSEFVFLPGALAEENFFNARCRTEALISFYKKIKPKVGTSDIKSMKKLWELVARDMSNLFQITISATKCENKWKVLERNYKKVVDNNNKTGRGRKTFEFEEEFEEIFGRKKNINPTILLSASEAIGPSAKYLADSLGPEASMTFGVCDSMEQKYQTQSHQTPIVVEIAENMNPETPSTSSGVKRKKSVRNVTSNYKKRNEILLEMKNDLKKYYEDKSRRDEVKLELERKKHEERVHRTTILQEYIESLKKNGEH